MLKRSSKDDRSERFVAFVRSRRVTNMKTISIALLSAFIGVLSGCSSTQDAGSTGATPTPTVAVPPVETATPVADKPLEDKPVEVKPTDTEEPPPPAGGGRLAMQQCSEESRKMKGCTKELNKVCAEVDTGIRCVRAPCPSTAPQTFDNPCLACSNKNVRGYWPISCEEMAKPTAP
jgi:hypothetical protein